MSSNQIAVTTGYIPSKVLRLAQDMGVHVDCMEADFEGACTGCVSLIHTAFDTFYGEAESANDAFMMILSDIMKDHD